MTIAERIKEYRKQHHYTQKELATLINVKPTTVSGWELGRNIPSIEMLQKLADIFHVPFDELAGVKDSNYHSSDPKEDDLKTADLADDDTIFTFEGKPIPEQDLEYMKRLLRGGRK
ncbi:helix-turn-helix transcriptional regulator [Limosilactobacillus sp. WILCCON 0053]|uniref:helix-turn-helix domain-containing protein n=1 Tax=Limosilactobacillus allomucosae TaxID=3142938 RepID=UPI003263377F